MSIMEVARKKYQAGTYAPGAPAEFLKPFGEQLADLTMGELKQPIDISKISPQVAQMSPLVQQAMQRSASQAGLGQLQFDPTTGEVTGVGTGTGIAAYEPYLQKAEAAAGPDAYKSYMSPYQQEVLDATQKLLNEQRATGRQALAPAQIEAGAFGQGRGQIAEAEYERQRDVYDTGIMSKLRQEGFLQAQQQAQQDMLNQLRLGAGQSAFESGITQALGATGAGAQQYSQSILDAMRQGNMLGMNYPLERIQAATNIFGGIGAGVPSQFPTAPMTTNPALAATQAFASIYGGLGGGQKG